MPGRRRRLLSPSALLRRSALYKGLLGGQRGWLVFGAVFFWLPNLLKKLFGRKEELLTVQKLSPGQSLSAVTIAPLSRRQRRQQRRGGSAR